jgi:cell division protein FtsI (penicillin-binding protein 3)
VIPRPRARLVALLAVMVLGFTGIAGRLAVLATRDRATLVRMGLDQRLRTVSLSAERGEIVDRNRDALAVSVQGRDVYVDPRFVSDPAAEARRLASALGTSAAPLERELRTEGSFVYVARELSLKRARAINAMHLPGVGLLPSTRRFYPGGSVASQVLGFVGTDGSGLSGLETEYDRTLSGVPGERTTEVGQDGTPILTGLTSVHPPQPGADLVTTIDRDLQYFAQSQLEQAVKANHARGGAIVVMDPRTGDVLAMANYPWFDPNRFASFGEARYRNRVVTDSFEPGSVNKVITATAAVQEHAFALDHRFTVPDHLGVDGYTIHDSHPHPAERMTLADIIAQSSNVGAVKVADILGARTLSAYLTRFGFGRPTGLGFPGESGGIVPALSDWSRASLATIAYGQGVAATPLQMASVYATIASGGISVTPRLVEGTVDASGGFHAAPASARKRVISESTARTVSEMLAYVVQKGTGIAAQIPGYQVAGKTGTALKPDPRTGGYSQNYVASFIGFLPASQPKVVVAAIIDEPTTVYGGVAAAPLFQRVARYSIQRLGIPAAVDIGLPPHAFSSR